MCSWQIIISPSKNFTGITSQRPLRSLSIALYLLFNLLNSRRNVLSRKNFFLVVVLSQFLPSFLPDLIYLPYLRLPILAQLTSCLVKRTTKKLAVLGSGVVGSRIA